MFDRPDGMAFQHLIRAIIVFCSLLLVGQLYAAPPDKRICALERASYLLLDDHGETLAACRPDTPLIPASTQKILTAWLALDHWGPDFRFSTDFYIDEDQLLWVRGRGDPMLVSEELGQMAEAIARLGLTALTGIGVDSSYYATHIEVPGRSGSDNPYDAPVAALAVNFNTVNLSRKHGKLQSAEAQTPLTATARRLGKRVNGMNQRINLRTGTDSGVYFAEILRHKLNENGLSVGSTIRQGRVPTGAKRVHHHENSRTLSDVIGAMLKYSTNFIANELFLNLGADAFEPPADMDKAVRYATRRIEERFGWQDVRILEGAGLSRANRLSARQLAELLQAFQPWKHLLPDFSGGVKAKTGTLNGIRTLAGYLEPDEADLPFAILINSPAPRNLRHDLVEQWSKRRSSQ